MKALTTITQHKMDYLEFEVMRHNRKNIPTTAADICRKLGYKNQYEFLNKTLSLKKENDIKRFNYQMRGKYGNNKSI